MVFLSMGSIWNYEKYIEYDKPLKKFRGHNDRPKRLKNKNQDENFLFS